MDERLKRLGQRIRELRLQKGWSQEEFADVCRVHRTYMGHLERGEKNVSFGSLARLADALNVTLAELLSGIESEQESAGSKSRPAPPIKGNLGISRQRLIQELRALERAAGSLRETVENVNSKKK